jgi:integrase
MAYIRAHNTTIKRKGKVIKRYEVVWREPHPTQPGKVHARQESFTIREAAEARRDELNNAKHSVGGTAALADAKKAGALPFGHYAESWLDAQAAAVGNGELKAATAAKYKRLLEFYVLPDLGGTPVVAINAAWCRKFRAVLVNRGSRVGDGKRLSPGTVKHIWVVFRAVLAQAAKDGAISANPADSDEYRRKRASGDRAKFEHHPLKPAELGYLCAALTGQRANGDGAVPAYAVYALMVEFMAATGLRVSEVAGLEVGDLARTPAPLALPPLFTCGAPRNARTACGLRTRSRAPKAFALCRFRPGWPSVWPTT